MDYRLRRALDRMSEQRIPLLGVGPMSKTVIDCTVDLANQYKLPIALIPSRRQIDSSANGGGYVMNWTTNQFASYVRSTDQLGMVLLSRDHSGPWQGSESAQTQYQTLGNQMTRALEDIMDDLQCGFDQIHVDPSPALNHGVNQDEVDLLAVDLIQGVMDRTHGKPGCVFEVGTDEQSDQPDNLDVVARKIDRIVALFADAGLELPHYLVLQTGTQVKETRNVGSFDSTLALKGFHSPAYYIPEVLKMCHAVGMRMKEHNADYLSDWSLRWHRRFGIDAVNVAPEFGVIETRTLLELMSSLDLRDQHTQFIQHVVQGGKYQKWLLPDRTYDEKALALIGGHYHFSDPRIQDIRQQLVQAGSRRGLDVEQRVSTAVRDSIDRYLRAFGYGAC